ncbi:hypothetical protein GCM10009623_14640 [Nocardioides aestuarii]|uniref:ADP ribosyltransferase domain-containing protein n=1 Tax=Nocardioides aestuarii TaxID=252231 RepID=A0ABW4TJP3_9ACTN
MSQQIRPTGDYATTLDGELWDVDGPATVEPLTLRRRDGSGERRSARFHEIGPVERVTTYGEWRGRRVRVDALTASRAGLYTWDRRMAGPRWTGDDRDGWSTEVPRDEVADLREVVTWVTRGWPVADPPPDAVSGRITDGERVVRRIVTASWQGEPVSVDARRDDGTVLVGYHRSAARAAELGMAGDRDQGWHRWVAAQEVRDVRVRDEELSPPEPRPEPAPGTVRTATREQVSTLLGALEKLPPHRGVSYRGIPAAARFGHHEGQVVVTQLLTASSRDVRVATENFTSAGLYVIVGRTGRAIERLSQHPEEREVAFLPVSTFLVLQRARIGDLLVVVVEQLNPELGIPDDPLATLEDLGRLAAVRVREGREQPPVRVGSPGKYCGDIE